MNPRIPPLVLVVVLSGTAASLTHATPANDGFSAPTLLGPALPSTKTGEALGATLEAGEVILDSLKWNGTLWFKWAPTAAGTGYAVPTFTWTADGNGDVNGSDFEMIVYKGTTLAGLTPVARGSETSPPERFPFSTGQTYYFQVHVTTGPAAASFPYSIALASAAAPPSAPANDAFASAVTLSGNPPPAKAGTTAGATLESGETADSPGVRTVWYKYVPSATVTRAITLSTSETESYPVLEIFTGASVAALTRVARTDMGGESLVPLTASTTYYFRVSNDDSYSNAGAFEIQIAAQPTGTAPANNNFASATNLGSDLDTPVTSTTFKSSLESSEKNPFAVGGTVWFKWTAPAEGWYSVSATSDSWPPALAVWSGSALAGLKLRSASDSYDAAATFRASAGEVLYFQAGEEGGYAFDFDITVSNGTDPEPPRLTSLTLSAASVNVTSSAQDVTATVTLAGPEDGIVDSVYLLHPNGGIAAFVLTEDFTLASGTPGNGTYTATLTVPKGLAAGSYSLVAYTTSATGTYFAFGSTSLITPQSPTWAWWEYSDVPSGTDALTVTNTGTADAAPALTSFTVTPASADAGTADATFNLSAVLTDAQGVYAASVDWADPSGVLTGSTITLARTAGTALNGTWTGSITIPRYSAAGRLNLTLRFEDTVGQSKRYGIQPEAGALYDKFEGRMQTMTNAIATVTNSVGTDFIPPQISEVAVTPNPATFALGGTVDVTISARVKDAYSGVASVEATIDTVNFVSLTRTSGTASDGIYSGVLTVYRTFSEPGPHDVMLFSTDVAGNPSLFTPAVPGLPVLTLNALPGGYDEWAGGHGLSSLDDDPLAEPQGDGLCNALKFACNLDPVSTTIGAARQLDPLAGTSGLPCVRRIGSGATARMSVTFLRRLSTPGLIQVVEFCSDPEATDAQGWTPASGTETRVSLNNQWERVTVEDVAGAGQSSRFGRMRVEVTR